MHDSSTLLLLDLLFLFVSRPNDNSSSGCDESASPLALHQPCLTWGQRPDKEGGDGDQERPKGLFPLKLYPNEKANKAKSGVAESKKDIGDGSQGGHGYHGGRGGDEVINCPPSVCPPQKKSPLLRQERCCLGHQEEPLPLAVTWLPPPLKLTFEGDIDDREDGDGGAVVLDMTVAGNGEDVTSSPTSFSPPKRHRPTRLGTSGGGRRT